MKRPLCKLVLQNGATYQIERIESLTAGNRPVAICDQENVTEVLCILEAAKDIVIDDVEILLRGIKWR